MSFLAPWALAIGGLASLGMVLLHLVARQRPAAYLFPTTRFVPDKRTLVSRAATRPRDLLLLLLRLLLLMVAAAAFARPVMTPSRGALARIILVDRSRATSDVAAGLARARALASDGAPFVIFAFDTATTKITSVDSLASVSRSGAAGSVSTALVAARRASVMLADRADSVQLVIISPLMASEFDEATARARAAWPGAIRTERIAASADTSSAWTLEHPLPVSDPLGPTTVGLDVHATRKTRLVRGTMTPNDSVFGRDGGTVVRWDSASARHPAPEGLSVNEDVIVASLERMTIPASGRVIARWADGAPAATEVTLGKGCLRTVGVALPGAGDLALHPPFQRIARALLAPCGVSASDHGADSATMKMLTGSLTASASGAQLRIAETRASPLARWLLAIALVLALVELAVRSRAPQVPA